MLHVRLMGIALVLALGVALAQAQTLPRYRDVKVYTTSAADPQRAQQIIARTEFVNAGAQPLAVQARLHPSEAVGFLGADYAATLAPGQSSVWEWRFTPPAGVTREILTGLLQIDGQPALARDLFVAIQGADPADFQDSGAEQITEAARVVATYAPLSQAALQTQLQQRAAHRPEPLLTLAHAGASDYTLVVDALPTPPVGQDALTFWKAQQLTGAASDLLAAVEDLRRCIALQSDATLPVAAMATGPAIRIRPAAVAAPGLQDAYRLKTEGENLVIEANTADGLRNGIYGLLTDYLDCHWFQPRQLGEEIGIPVDRAVRVPALDEVQGSSWYSCNGASWGYDQLWDRRNRAFINRARMNFGHSWFSYVNNRLYPYDQFPEYYARDRAGQVRFFDNGWSHTNFCSTNPAVIEIVAQQVNAFFKNNPEAVVCSLDSNDYAPMCLCDDCLALDKQYGQTREDGTEVADRLLHFSQQIYDRLDPQYQEKYLGILVYAYKMELPLSAKPHANHAGIICNFLPHYDFSRPWNDPTSVVNRDFLRLVQGWGSQLQQLGYYDYYGHYYYFGPFAMAHKMREDLPAFREMGGTFLVLEMQPNFGMQGLNHYLVARYEWDVDADADLLMEEFFTRYYGPAAEAMRAFWLTAEKYYALERPGTQTETRVAARPEFWAELEGHLARAQQATANLPAAQQRFADRIQVRRDAFDYARLHTDYSFTNARRQMRLGWAIDHAEAIEFLQQHRARIETLQQKYRGDDPYWPQMIAGYFHLNVDEEIKRHEEAMQGQ